MPTLEAASGGTNARIANEDLAPGELENSTAAPGGRLALVVNRPAPTPHMTGAGGEPIEPVHRHASGPGGVCDPAGTAAVFAENTRPRTPFNSSFSARPSPVRKPCSGRTAALKPCSFTTRDPTGRCWRHRPPPGGSSLTPAAWYDSDR